MPNNTRNVSEKQHDAQVGMTAVEIALDPVVRRPLTVVPDNGGISSGGTVELVALEDHTPQAEDQGTMGIANLVGVGVMPSMHGHPLFRDDPRAVPQPETEQVTQHRVEGQTTMRLIPVQVERDTQEHHLDGDESHRHVAPERQLEEDRRGKERSSGHSTPSKGWPSRYGAPNPAPHALRKPRPTGNARESRAAAASSRTGARRSHARPRPAGPCSPPAAPARSMRRESVVSIISGRRSTSAFVPPWVAMMAMRPFVAAASIFRGT